jgi:very-short-patch-repair endonuclease
MKKKTKEERYPTVMPILLTLDPFAASELKFHATRKWRADFALPSFRILIEVDGGVWSGGRHTRGAGFIKDQEKTNAAGILGWIVLRFTPKDVENKSMFEVVRSAVAAVKAKQK